MRSGTSFKSIALFLKTTNGSQYVHEGSTTLEIRMTSRSAARSEPNQDYDRIKGDVMGAAPSKIVRPTKNKAVVTVIHVSSLSHTPLRLTAWLSER